MEYYKLLNLNREPFSNSPDPELFFRSQRHARCLQELEIAIRLHRGLSVVAGEVGTGKTTICRHLIRSMADDETLEIHMILDPSYESAEEMLGALNTMFNGKDLADRCSTQAGHKEMIKDYLFKKGVDEKKTVILLIDEGQKLSYAGAEILREILNYETNHQKLLQIIIFAQNEIGQLLARQQNFADRIGLFHKLLPLTLKDTTEFINYRLECSGANDPAGSKVFFTRRSIRLIHAMTGGSPRKIINLCHNILLALIISGSFRVTPSIVHKASGNLPALKRPPGFRRLFWAMGAAASVLVLLWLFVPGFRSFDDRVSQILKLRDTNTAEKQQHRDFVLQARAEQASGEEKSSGDKIFVHESDNPGSDNFPGKSPRINLLVDDGFLPAGPAGTSVAGIKKPPSSLGFVRVSSNGNLWRMIERIYGTCNFSMLREVARYNPAIKNLNIIHRGQQINFPVMNMRQPLDSERYWIEFARFSSLDEAYQGVIRQPDDSLRILGVWDMENGFQYLVVADTPFKSRDTAEMALDELPAGLAQGAMISGLDEQVMISRI